MSDDTVKIKPSLTVIHYWHELLNSKAEPWWFGMSWMSTYQKRRPINTLTYSKPIITAQKVGIIRLKSMRQKRSRLHIEILFEIGLKTVVSLLPGRYLAYNKAIFLG